ncbi:uncharacterized protein BYT42DRAFT_550599 [Radiomyces spectabilis]|uniref:uncharacterized protein n=1 Tax=Radiomyces spectabilis TaxID=64574 RepID=UPI00221F1E95|nr:uncharacterized protein BYT42DRAFT_550599 [Radiomyces spectabilis]KAI8393306.1 hypothetical protein BYT42DRAFT_550599 [Radiomyces spectabilis]
MSMHVCPLIQPTAHSECQGEDVTCTNGRTTITEVVDQKETMSDDGLSKGDLSESGPLSSTFPYTIVTAASSNHFCALESMLYSLKEVKMDVTTSMYPRLVVYDLGLTETQRAVLRNLYEHQFFDDLVTLNYSAYPSFWDITVNRGEYAWKVGAIKESQIKYGGVIVWLDTGDIPNRRFMETIPTYIRQHGFWSPRSTGLMGAKFNHDGLFAYFKTTRKQYAKWENCNGAALGFDTENAHVMDQILNPWFDCALEKECIAPQGSSRANHRQDQSAVTLLALRAGYQCFEYPEFHGITIHQDDLCQQRLAYLEEHHHLLHPSSYDVA